MEGVYLLQPNGNITSLLSGYSKNFEEEAFKEFGDKTQQFGQLFEEDFVEVCNRRVFSFNVGEGTRLSFVFFKDSPGLDNPPDPIALFRVAFKSFTSKLIPKLISSPDTETEQVVEHQKMMLVEGESEAIAPVDLLRSSELLLQLAFDYQNLVPDPVFAGEEWQSMLRVFKDDLRIAAVRSSCLMAAKLSTVQDQLAHVQQAFETSRSLQDQREKRIDVLSKAVQTLYVHLEKSEQCQTSNSSHLPVSETASSPITTLNNSLLEAEEKKLVSTTISEEKQVTCVEGEEKGLSDDHGNVNTDSNPVDAEETNATVANELEKLLMASKHAIFYLQRDLEAIKLERDSYYHQVLELRRARQIYEIKRHSELENIPPAEPPNGFQKKKKLKAEDASASTNGKTNILNGKAG